MNCVCCHNELTGLENITAEQPATAEKLWFCRRCGHGQLKTLPTEDSLAAFYEKDYSETRRSFLNENYFRIMRKRAKAQFDFIDKHLPAKIKTAGDLGCGFGLLIEKLNKKHIEAYGLEYDPVCLEFGKRNRIDIRPVKDLPVEIRPADLLIMSHSLEHFSDIRTVLKTVREKSKYCFIEVPDCDLMSSIFGDFDGHVNFFTTKSLASVLTNSGFEVISLGRYGPSSNLNYEQKKDWLKKLLQRVTGDQFMNLYRKQSQNGMWIRALVKSKK